MKKKVAPILVLLGLVALSLPACDRMQAEEKENKEQQKIVVTSPEAKDIILTQQYVCQIRSQNHSEVCAMAEGYLDEILVKEGQAVKKGQVMFRIRPVLYKAKLDSERAEADLAQIKFNNTEALWKKGVVSIQEVNLAQAELNKALARAASAAAELEFTNVVGPFDGIVDRRQKQLGSLIAKTDVLTTLSDNSLMWVYFNVPEARYLEYMRRPGATDPQHPQLLKLKDSRIELVLADGSKFNQPAGDTVTIEAKANNENGNFAFRADFPNPDGLLRHGQTGTVLIHRKMPHAIVIPQRATFEFLDKQYVYVVGDDHVVHQRLITVEREQDDVFIIQSGIGVNDKIVLEGIRQLHEGQKLDEFEYKKPEEALANQKFHAE